MISKLKQRIKERKSQLGHNDGQTRLAESALAQRPMASAQASAHNLTELNHSHNNIQSDQDPMRPRSFQTQQPGRSEYRNKFFGRNMANRGPACQEQSRVDLSRLSRGEERSGQRNSYGGTLEHTLATDRQADGLELRQRADTEHAAQKTSAQSKPFNDVSYAAANNKSTHEYVQESSLMLNRTE